jgi:hypothetical protein
MIRILIDFSVSECDAGFLMPKVGKLENAAEWRCG